MVGANTGTVMIMKGHKALVAVGVAVLLLLSVQALAQDRPFWAEDIDVHSIDVAEAIRSYSLWGLLAESVAKSTNPRSRVQVEAYYVNPITYIHLRGGGAQQSPEELRNELSEVYGRYRVFYVLLKTSDDPRLVGADDWRFGVRTTENRELEPERIESAEPELVFGYTGTHYQTKLMLFFSRHDEDGDSVVDILRGDYLVASNRAQRLREDIRWGAAVSASVATNPVARAAFKASIVALLVVLAALCLLTRPRKEWLAKRN